MASRPRSPRRRATRAARPPQRGRGREAVEQPPSPESLRSTATGAPPAPGGPRRGTVRPARGQHQELAGRRVDAGQRQDVRAVRDQDQVAVGRALTGQPADRARPLRLPGPVLEDRVERLPGLRATEREARRLETPAPVARQHAPDRHTAGPEGRADPPRLVAARVGQVALGGAVRRAGSRAGPRRPAWSSRAASARPVRPRAGASTAPRRRRPSSAPGRNRASTLDDPHRMTLLGAMPADHRTARLPS